MNEKPTNEGVPPENAGSEGGDTPAAGDRSEPTAPRTPEFTTGSPDSGATDFSSGAHPFSISEPGGPGDAEMPAASTTGVGGTGPEPPSTPPAAPVPPVPPAPPAPPSPPSAAPPTSQPPGWTPPPPPPAPPGGPPTDDYVPAGIPWERRDQLGTWPALLETIRRSLLEPKQFFRDLPAEGPTPPATYGPIGSALLYAILIAIPSAIIAIFWQMFASWFSMLSGDGEEALLSLGHAMFMALAMPIMVPIALVITAAVVHLLLMILGGANKSLVATFRVLCYASAPDLLGILPICGTPIALVWGTVLMIIGLSTVHRTSVVKAALAVLLPGALCCGCIAILLGLAVLGAD